MGSGISRGDPDMGKDARGRSGRKAQEKIIKKEGSVRTDRSPEIETDVDSSYELQIKKISTCWKITPRAFQRVLTCPQGADKTAPTRADNTALLQEFC